MTENIAGLVERLREMAPEEGRTIRCNDRTTAMMNRDIREAATALEEQQKLLEEVREALARYQGVRAGRWFYPEGNTDSDSCCFSPEEVLEEHYSYHEPLKTGVYLVERALPLPDLFGAVRAYSEEEKDARDLDDDYDVTWHLSREEAEAALTRLNEGASRG